MKKENSVQMAPPLNDESARTRHGLLTPPFTGIKKRRIHQQKEICPISTLTAPKPHTLAIPPDLFARIAKVAEAKGQDTNDFILTVLSEAVGEPNWKAKLRRGQKIAQQAFEASGMTQEEIAANERDAPASPRRRTSLF